MCWPLSGPPHASLSSSYFILLQIAFHLLAFDLSFAASLSLPRVVPDIVKRGYLHNDFLIVASSFELHVVPHIHHEDHFASL
jgi:hypothetical protein